MAFGKMYLTKKGQELLYKCQAGQTLEFTRFGLGDGELGSQAISTLTNLINEKMSVAVSKLKIQEDKVIVGINFNNSEITEGFYFREIGIFAKDTETQEEVLYMYANASDTADYISEAGTDVLEKNLDVDIFISDVENITANIDTSLVFVTQQELEETIGDINTILSSVVNGGEA